MVAESGGGGEIGSSGTTAAVKFPPSPGPAGEPPSAAPSPAAAAEPPAEVLGLAVSLPPPRPPPKEEESGEMKGHHHKPLTAADYIKLINIRTAKILALLLVLGFGVYHGLLHLYYGVTPCKGLYKDGMFKGELWQPWGCMMHKYTKADAERCFRYNAFYGRGNHFAFVGDSRVRQLYQATRRLLEMGLDPEYMTEGAPAHHDMNWESAGIQLKLDFFWAPQVNDSMFQALTKLKSRKKLPSVLVIGSATHTIKSSNNSADALQEYRKNLTLLRPDLEEFGLKGTMVLWMMQPSVYKENLHPVRRMITPGAVHRYNTVARNVLGPSGQVQLWSSMASLCEEDLDQMQDGLHMPARSQKQATLMLLNSHCNDNMNFDDGTCCKSSNKATNLQIIFFSFLALCATISLLSFLRLHCCVRRSAYHQATLPMSSFQHTTTKTMMLYQLLTTGSTGLPHRTVRASANGGPGGGAKDISDSGLDLQTFFFAFAKLGVILAYFYVCDRTNYFMKENKYFTPLSFWLPVLYVFVVGLFFNEEAKSSKFLNREQTDEWKGWMQLVILIYHMTGASRAVPIYMHMRVLVSSYIFLNAYGHFFYAWLRGDASMHRFFQVLFRMNFLTVVLCLAMNQPYQAYYFVPLISFWFSLQYAMMAIPPMITAKSTDANYVHYLYLVVKIVVVLCVISVFYISEVFFEKVFLTRPWKALFVTTDDDIREWWFRWRLDRYSMLFGFTFAFVTAVGQKFKLFDDSQSCSLWPRPMSALVSLGCVGGLVSYLVFALYCRGKVECNEVHPYLAVVPIVSFILLRNLWGFLRGRYSSFFAWFGRISLELFISQYHIWLAADTHGILVLIPNYPVFNALVTSFVFVCAAHEIGEVTSALAPFFVPRDRAAILRNLAAFLLCLVPIGVSDGMI